MLPWGPIAFLPNEDEAALRAEYIRLAAHYLPLGYSPYDVAMHVFKDLPDPILRSQQAADYWGKDLEVVELIRQVTLLDQSNIEADRLERSLWAIADDTRCFTKDRLEALKQLAVIGGRVVKAIELRSNSNKTEPTFRFIIDPNAGQPPEVNDGV